MTLEAISAKYDFEKIKQIFPAAPDVSEEVLRAKSDEFADSEHSKVFRGKYELWFMRKIIELALQDSASSQKYIKEKIKFSFSEQLSNEQALSLFSAYAETPECLKDYLKQALNNSWN